MTEFETASTPEKTWKNGVIEIAKWKKEVKTEHGTKVFYNYSIKQSFKKGDGWGINAIYLTQDKLDLLFTGLSKAKEDLYFPEEENRGEG